MIFGGGFGSCIMDGFQYTVLHGDMEIKSKNCS